MDSESVCLAVWPGRAQWRTAPWYQRSIHLCQLGSNICARKVQATVYDPGRATNVADDERIFGLCLQRAYDTGTLPYLEAWQYFGGAAEAGAPVAKLYVFQCQIDPKSYIISLPLRR